MDQQRIVGIQIPPDSVGAVLRSIGLTRDLREPDEIFYAVLDEGEEITLASNLKLRRGSIHSEPAIELSGADPYKFAELRELGLIKEQINWKQRLSIPTDETTGVEILSALLVRYPLVVGAEAATEPEVGIIEASAQISPTNIIDLGQWIVAVAERNCGEEAANVIEVQLEGEALALEIVAEEMPLHKSEDSNLYSAAAERPDGLARAVVPRLSNGVDYQLNIVLGYLWFRRMPFSGETNGSYIWDKVAVAKASERFKPTRISATRGS